jgi:hypothetical protein
MPMCIITTPANVHDSKPAMTLIDQMPRMRDAQNRLRKPLRIVIGDKAYGTTNNKTGCRKRGITPMLDSPRSTRLKSLGGIRYVVERTLACIGHHLQEHCRRIKLCYEKTAAHFQAFHELAAILLCIKHLYPRKQF